MREISKNILVLPNFKGEKHEIESILSDKSQYGVVEAVVLLDPMAYHQVKTIYIK